MAGARESQKWSQIPWNWDYEWLCATSVSWGLNPGPLQEQMYLTDHGNPCLQSSILFLKVLFINQYFMESLTQIHYGMMVNMLMATIFVVM